MKRKQREMQENGGSLGCPGLEVSRKRAENLDKLHPDDLVLCLMKWRTTVAITSLRATVRKRRRRLRKRRKKTSPQRRSLLSTWDPRKSQTPRFHLTNATLTRLLSLALVGMLVWCCFLAGVQRLGHQLEEGPEGPEEREKGNKEGRKEENKEGATETAGWEFTLCPPKKGARIKSIS